MKLDSKIPAGTLQERWTRTARPCRWFLLRTNAKWKLSWWGPAWPVHRLRLLWPSLATRSRPFVFRIHHAGPTVLQRRGGSTRPKTTKTTGIPFIVCSMIPLRGGITEPAKPMCIAWPKSVPPSMRCAGCAFCQGLRWNVGQPFVWRNPGIPYVLCPRSNRAAIVVGGLFGPEPSNCKKASDHVQPTRNGGIGDRGRQSQGHYCQEPGYRGARKAFGPRGGFGLRWLR